MSDFSLLAGFFAFVMASVALAGYAFWERGEKPSGESRIGDLRPAGAQTFLAQAFRRVGETVPAAKAGSNPTRNLLMSAGYRDPAAVSIFYGVKYGSAVIFAAALVVGS